MSAVELHVTTLDERVIELRDDLRGTMRLVDRLRPLLDILSLLEGLAADAAYRARVRKDGEQRVKRWQLRLGICAGLVTMVSVIVGSLISILHGLGIG